MGRPSVYRNKAFISYSRSESETFALALQGALEQFGKPWYQRRAFRVFLDKESLGAGPRLSRRILDQLEDSEYLILIASPSAIQRPWVQEEILQWFALPGREARFLIALAGGTIGSAPGGNVLDWAATTALPEGLLADKLREVPVYVDFTWATGRTEFSVDDPRFREKVRALAATLHGCDPGDLESREQTRHRRVRALVRSVGLLVALVLIVGVLALQRATVAKARALESIAEANLNIDPALAVHIAAKADRLSRWTGQRMPGVLIKAIFESHLRAIVADDTNAFTCLAASPDGQWLAAAGASGEIHTWKITRRAGELELMKSAPASSYHRTRIHLLTFSPASDLLLSADDQGGLAAWRLGSNVPVSVLGGTSAAESLEFQVDGRSVEVRRQTGEPVKWEIEGGFGLPAADPNKSVAPRGGLWFGGDQSFLAGMNKGGETIQRSTLDRSSTQLLTLSSDGKTLNLYAGPPFTNHLFAVKYRADLVGAVLSPDGKWIAAAVPSEHAAVVWPTRSAWSNSPAPWLLLKGHRTQINAVAFIGDASWLVTASGPLREPRPEDDNSIRTWRLRVPEAPRCTNEVEDPWRVALSRNTNLALIQITTHVVIQNYETGDVLQNLQHEGLGVEAASLAANAQVAAVAYDDKSIRAYEVVSGRMFGVYTQHQSSVQSVRLSDDGRLAASVADDSVLHLWNTSNGTVLGTVPHTDAKAPVAFSGDASLLLVGGDEHRVHLWQLRDGRPAAQSFRELPLEVGINDAAFSPTTSCVALAGKDGSVRVWDYSRDRIIAYLQGHVQPVTSVAYNRDGGYLVSASRDFQARVWRADDGYCFAVLDGNRDQMLGAAFTPDGRKIVTISRPGVLFIHDCEECCSASELRRIAEKRARPRLLTPSERRMYLWE